MYIHHMSRMVRKQVYLTQEQDQRVRRAAALSRRTDAAIIREALDRHLEPQRSKAPLEEDPLWGIVGLGKSSKGDLSERVDEYLYGRRD